MSWPSISADRPCVYKENQFWIGFFRSMASSHWQSQAYCCTSATGKEGLGFPAIKHPTSFLSCAHCKLQKTVKLVQPWFANFFMPRCFGRKQFKNLSLSCRLFAKTSQTKEIKTLQNYKTLHAHGKWCSIKKKKKK